MSTKLEDKLAEARKAADAELEAKLKKIEFEHAIRELAPEGIEVKSISYHKYNDVTAIRHDAVNAAEVLNIITAYRAKYVHPFLPVGKYSDGCTTITAYPYGLYAEPDALKKLLADAVVARNSMGRGFTSVEFEFYPPIEGHRIVVQISLTFRSYIIGFEGTVSCRYDQYGNPRNVQKYPPKKYGDAAYTVSYGGGGDDSADWRGVFEYHKFIGAIA